MLRTPLVLVSVLLASCGADLLAPGFERSLSQRGGCGDVIFFAVDSADRLMLTFQVDGLVAEARTAGEPLTTVIDLSHVTATAFVEQGARVSDATCDDVIEGAGPRVDRTWTAVSGRATVTMRPDGVGDTARADAVLEDAVFRAHGGGSIEISRLEWTDTTVGWYAG